MEKLAIVGVEDSGKTVMFAGLGDQYTYPDEDGYCLAPKNFGTAAYVAEKIERMRKGEWQVVVAGHRAAVAGRLPYQAVTRPACLRSRGTRAPTKMRYVT